VACTTSRLEPVAFTNATHATQRYAHCVFFDVTRAGDASKVRKEVRNERIADESDATAKTQE